MRLSSFLRVVFLRRSGPRQVHRRWGALTSLAAAGALLALSGTSTGSAALVLVDASSDADAPLEGLLPGGPVDRPSAVPDVATGVDRSASDSPEGSSAASGVATPASSVEARIAGLRAAVDPSSGPLPYAWTEDRLLPFPSDVYTVPDASSATGLRMVPPEGFWPEQLLTSAPFKPKEILERMREMDGFSPNLPLLVSLPGDLDASSLPVAEATMSESSPIRLIHLASGRSLPFRCRTLSRTYGKADRTLLVLHPENRLEHGARYLVVIRTGLKDRAGALIPDPPGFREGLTASATPGGPFWQPWMTELGGLVRQQGIDPADVAMAFAFTVQSRDNYLGPLKALDAQVEQKRTDEPYRVTRLKLWHPPFKDQTEAGLWGRGSFEVLRFSDEMGVRLAVPRREEVDFVLRMPESCPPEGCAVAIFGHGLGATRDSIFQVADPFAARGIATIAIGAPYHTRQTEPLKVIYRTKRNLNLLHGVFVEHIMGNLQLVELIRQDLANRDFRSEQEQRENAGVPLRLRADRIYYIGQSMGGICGVATSVLGSDIRGSLFDVAGGGTIDIFFDSWVVRMMKIPMLEFKGVDDMLSMRMVPLAMHLFDDVDPLGFAPFLSIAPLPGEEKRYISQHIGLGDGLVPNWTSEKLGRALGLSIMRPASEVRAAITGTPVMGVRYFRNTGNWFLAHLELFRAKSSSTAAGFFSWAGTQLDAPASLPGVASSAVGTSAGGTAQRTGITPAGNMTPTWVSAQVTSVPSEDQIHPEGASSERLEPGPPVSVVPSPEP